MERVPGHLTTRLQEIEQHIVRACERAGRERSSVTLVAVTKTYPIAVVLEAMAAGVQHFGENRVQELTQKVREIQGATGGDGVFWHMIGHIQRNKVRDVVACADFVHSVDRLELAEELDARAQAAGRRMPCFVQVNVSGEASKFGADPDALAGLLEGLRRLQTLDVLGFMTLASPTDDPESVRPEFRRLREVFDRARSDYSHLAGMNALSMGMSGDFEVAIEEGATHVRIGSALFGPRS
ncbi:MAG: YggS family pyridoxal phosphate-dependent enzyme [Rhodothermales bacterium]|nr:YggS family pyridoxal phosphate-dependent enzyme [Rhodothermales bacterium]